MERVIGIGGIFFRAKDPAALGAWYKAHLGIDVQAWGGAIFRAVDDGAEAMTVWSVGNGDNFRPGHASFMVNYRVRDLRGLLAQLQEEGCQVLGPAEESEFGLFGWVLDPEGNKVELWQAPAGG